MSGPSISSGGCLTFSNFSWFWFKGETATGAAVVGAFAGALSLAGLLVFLVPFSVVGGGRAARSPPAAAAAAAFWLSLSFRLL